MPPPSSRARDAVLPPTWTNAGHPFRPALGTAQSAVSIIASLGLLLLGVSLLRGVPVARGDDYLWPERAVTLAGLAYLASVCLIHARWGGLLRRGHAIGQEVALATSLGHAIVAVAVGTALSRGSESRLLLAQLQSASSAWLTVGCVGAVVSLGSCWIGYCEARAATSKSHPTLAGWGHALPPLVIALALAMSILWLEGQALPSVEVAR